MREVDWIAWIEYHSDRFGLSTPSDTRWFVSIKRILVNATLEELRHATDTISQDARSAREGRNLGLIQQTISQRRNARLKLERSDQERLVWENLSCKLCRGFGVVNVPHPESVVDGEWVATSVTPFAKFPMISVCCSCNIGSDKFNKLNTALFENRQQRGGPARSAIHLHEYEVRFPNWEEMLAERKEMFKDRAQADYHAKEAEKTSPINVKKVLDSIGKEQP